MKTKPMQGQTPLAYLFLRSRTQDPEHTAQPKIQLVGSLIISL